MRPTCKDYDISRIGGIGFRDDPRQVRLTAFHLRYVLAGAAIRQGRILQSSSWQKGKSRAQAAAAIQPPAVADDRCGKPVALIHVGWYWHVHGANMSHVAGAG